MDALVLTEKPKINTGKKKKTACSVYGAEQPV